VPKSLSNTVSTTIVPLVVITFSNQTKKNKTAVSLNAKAILMDPNLHLFGKNVLILLLWKPVLLPSVMLSPIKMNLF
jgi:hypothetical protein